MAFRRSPVRSAVGFALFAFVAASSPAFPQSANELLARLVGEDDARRGTARVAILRSQDRTLIPALVDALFFAPAAARADVVACLEGLSGEKLGPRHRYWVEWVGGHGEIRPHDGYRAWKASLFSRIDPAFGSFLDLGQPLAIRAEEIVWGGVRKDGLPALKSPRAVPVAEARAFSDTEVVFGVAYGGQFRAYPQRILTILSLDTGHRRDYSVGAAYGRYFASPDTMFPVWTRDDRLETKAWIYGLRSGGKTRAYPLDLLASERVVNDAVGAVPVVLVADPESGSVRAYYRGSRELAEGPAGRLTEPSTGTNWRIGEEALVAESSGATPLPRLPGHRAYWFGWYAFFPETSLYEGCAQWWRPKSGR